MQQFQETADTYAADAREDPFSVVVNADELAALAEQVAANRNYELQAPSEAAIIYRLHAAALILKPNVGGVLPAVKDGLPWLARAVRVDPDVADIKQLRKAHAYFSKIAKGEVVQTEAAHFMRSAYRVAMVGSSEADVDSESAALVQALGQVVKGSAEDGTTTRDDFEFLWNYGTNSTVGELVETTRMVVSSRFPDRDVGGVPRSLPLENGNTEVTCSIHGAKEAVFQWEVSKAKNLIIPKTELAEEIMKLAEEEQ